MFQGHSQCSLDSKSRLILPAKFRKFMKPEADNKIVLTRGIDECLLAYPLDEWDKVKSGFTRFNDLLNEHRFFVRKSLYFAHECELDSQNRILIPQDLIDFAKLKKDVIVIGMLEKMEIWDPDIMERVDNAMSKSYEEIAEKVAEIRSS